MLGHVARSPRMQEDDRLFSGRLADAKVSNREIRAVAGARRRRLPHRPSTVSFPRIQGIQFFK
jgi:hypothetical protein